MIYFSFQILTKKVECYKMVDFAKYAKMGDINVHDDYTPKEQIDPSDELFKTIYISGSGQKEDEYTKTRLHVGMLQIKGTMNNLEEIYMIPYYRRQVLTNQVKSGKWDALKCFSYAEHDEEGNQISTSSFFCPQSSPDRKEIQWCSTCKTNFIIAGFLVDADGQYIMDSDKKPISVYIKATGSKVGDVMSYAFDCQDLEVPFLFTENNSKESDNFERKYSNMFRRIIKITAGETETYQGPNTPANAAKTRSCYILEGHTEIEKDKVLKLIDYADNIDDKLREKFDYTERAVSSCKKNFKQQLNTFQHSDQFKMNNPSFVPEKMTTSDMPSAPGFMTVDEPSSIPNPANIDTSAIPDSAPVTDDNPSKGGIDDIPF